MTNFYDNLAGKERIIVRLASVVLTSGPDVLLLLHDKCNSWMWPGGKVRPNHDEPDAPTELILEAAVRELWEEAAIRTHHTPICRIGDGEPFAVPTYPHGMPSFPSGNDRAKLAGAPYTILTYVGKVREESYDLLEDHIFWWEVGEDVRNAPLNPPEGHPMAWYNLRQVITGEIELPMLPEVRETLSYVHGTQHARDIYRTAY